MKIEWLKTTHGRVTTAILGTVAVLALGLGIGAAASAAGTDQPAIGLNAAGQQFFCIGSDKVMHVNPAFNNNDCPAGTNGENYPVSGAAVAAAVAPQLPRAYGLVNISRGGAAATTWATYDTILGGPAGDTASGTFRATCPANASNTPCKVSLAAYATRPGVSVSPRILIMKQAPNSATDPEVYCEYGDGENNIAGSVHSISFNPSDPTFATPIQVGIGSSLDCGAGQPLPPASDNGAVDSIWLPDDGSHYDFSTTLTFFTA